VITELLGASAEAYLSRQLHGNEPVDWKEPPPAEIDTSDLNVPRGKRSLDDLDRLRSKEDAQPLSTFIPKGKVAESFLMGFSSSSARSAHRRRRSGGTLELNEFGITDREWEPCSGCGAAFGDISRYNSVRQRLGRK